MFHGYIRTQAQSSTTALCVVVALVCWPVDLSIRGRIIFFEILNIRLICRETRKQILWRSEHPDLDPLHVQKMNVKKLSSNWGYCIQNDQDVRVLGSSQFFLLLVSIHINHAFKHMHFFEISKQIIPPLIETPFWPMLEPHWSRNAGCVHWAS
jgi:hypothetical protein